jgi:hypothetical protein
LLLMTGSTSRSYACERDFSVRGCGIYDHDKECQGENLRGAPMRC